MRPHADSPAIALRRPPSQPADATAWRAVLEHDATFDGRFVYGVTSTGIFCRPSCPSRRPRRNRVQFFNDPTAARAAGFRACKRCHPELVTPSRASTAVNQCLRYLRSHPAERTSLQMLASVAEFSPFHLQRIFTREVGVSPRQFQDALRQRYFVARLRAGDTVSRATFEAGYGSSSRVYDRSAMRAAMTPAAYRKGATGQHMHYAIVSVPLGRLLVAFTSDGVCAVELGDSDDALTRALLTSFPGAQIDRAPAAANQWVRAVAEQARGQVPAAAVPMDVRATAFQCKVWKALQQIPIGQTRSYAQVARAIGKPRAIRAVASACARNPIALVVPCHRVVRSDGAPGEYRWGAARKVRLLRAERKAANAQHRT